LIVVRFPKGCKQVFIFRKYSIKNPHSLKCAILLWNHCILHRFSHISHWERTWRSFSNFREKFLNFLAFYKKHIGKNYSLGSVEGEV
jgi:hypothetical protein